MSVDDVFLSRVGHDLRGELATMVTGVHYVLRYEPELGDAARQMLNRVHGAGQRLRRLLDELDDAAWIDGGDRATLAFEPCQADTLIRGALARLNQVVSAREVALDVEHVLGIALGDVAAEQALALELHAVLASDDLAATHADEADFAGGALRVRAAQLEHEVL